MQPERFLSIFHFQLREADKVEKNPRQREEWKKCQGWKFPTSFNKLTNPQLFSDAVVLKIILPVNERIYSGVDGGKMFCNDTESEKIANSLKCTL